MIIDLNPGEILEHDGQDWTVKTVGKGFAIIENALGQTQQIQLAQIEEPKPIPETMVCKDTDDDKDEDKDKDKENGNGNGKKFPFKNGKKKMFQKEEQEEVGETVASDSLHPHSRGEDDPRFDRGTAVSNLLGTIGKMPDKELCTWFEKTMSQFGHWADGVGSSSSHNKSTVNAKPSDAVGHHREAINRLFSGQELSEDFRDKAKVLWETALNEAMTAQFQKLETVYDQRLTEEVDQLTEDMVERLDAYVSDVADQWLEENRVATENALRLELTDEFIKGLRNLFKAHYIEIPEEKVNVVEELSERIEVMEERLDELLTENNELRDELFQLQVEEKFDEVASDLTAVQKEKLAEMAEDIEAEDLDTFVKKLKIIKDHHFGTKSAVPPRTEATEDTFEGGLVTEETVDPSVKLYVKALDRTIRV